MPVLRRPVEPAPQQRTSPSNSIISFCSLQVGQQECFYVGRHGDASDHVRPKSDWRRGNQLLREGDDLKIVVEMLATTTILRATCHAWKALAIMADATCLRWQEKCRHQGRRFEQPPGAAARRAPVQLALRRHLSLRVRLRCRRGSATEGVGDRLYFIWLAVASVTPSPRRRRLSP